MDQKYELKYGLRQIFFWQWFLLEVYALQNYNIYVKRIIYSFE